MDFKERLNKITLRNRKVKHHKGQVWPLEKKIEVVSQYLVLGNMKLVSATTGVNHQLIREWKGQPWWKELEAEIRATQNIEMDTKLTKIVDKSLDAVLDRVENGDFIYDQKSGQIKRRPAALRDIHRVATDTLSKRELLRHGVTERNEHTQVAVVEQLKLLKDEFAKWNANRTVPMVEEIEDAIPKEREEELQEGITMGEEDSSESSEGSSGEE